MASLLNTYFSGKSINSQFEMKRLYCSRMTFLLKKGCIKDKLLHDLYFSVSNRGLKKMLIRAIKQGQVENQFSYVEKQIGCDTVKLIHEYIYTRGGNLANLEKEVVEKLRLMEFSMKEMKRTMLKNKIRLLLNKTLFFLANIAFAYYLKNDYSFLIFIIVNTLGVIWFIVLDYESVLAVLEFRERKLVEVKAKRKKTLAPANTIKRCFSAFASLGLIINISMVAAGFLMQAI